MRKIRRDYKTRMVIVLLGMSPVKITLAYRLKSERNLKIYRADILQNSKDVSTPNSLLYP